MEGELHDRVRTVVRPEKVGRRKGGNPGKADAKQNHQRIMFLHSKGKSRKEIRADTGFSFTTIDLHLKGKIRGD